MTENEMTNQAAQTMPELPKAWGFARNVDGQIEIRIGPVCPPNRSGGLATPWAPMFGGDQMHQYARDYAAMLAAAPAASGGECTNPAPGHDAGEDLSDYVRIAHLIGSIFFYGNFKAETFNERELESLLRKVGRFYESEEQVISVEPAVERPLHFATENLIRRFSDALREKLSAAEKKYGYSDGWASPDWMDECRKHLMQHIAKGDPRDVAAYCAFLWHHGESTTPNPPSAASVSERARELLAAEYRTHGWHEDAGRLCMGGDPTSFVEDDALRVITRLIEQGDEDTHVITELGRLLAGIAVILKGPEPAGTAWSYHDLPELVASALSEPRQVAAEMKAWAHTKMAEQQSSRRDRMMVAEWAKRLLPESSFPVKDFDVEGMSITKEAAREAVKQVAIEQALTQQRGAVAWTHDAESWGNALNEAAWIFVYQCPEKSALLFNNTKAPLRAAILKYAELVGAATTPQPSADAVREVPDGMVLVPREPTREMIEAGVMFGNSPSKVSIIYQSMVIAAANDHQQNAAQGGEST